MKGIISLGEALIDFIPLDKENITYQKSPGGAPANVAVAAAKLGAKSTFVGKVGQDVLGEFLKETLQSHGVDVTSMILTEEARTGVVFVTLDESGERNFSFYIDPSADRFLSIDNLDSELFTGHNVLHYGSISMISEPSRSATLQAVKMAKEQNMIVSYDPNLRLGLWPSEKDARETISSMLKEASIVKISDEELTFLTGETELEAGIKKLSKYNIPVLLVTYGSKGSYVHVDNETIHVPAMKVETVDTTGAGDAFVSGILYQLSERNTALGEIALDQWKEIVEFASVSGALAASTRGAMTALPTLDEVKATLQK
ncbi:aminoimidazole riboside kinase [Alkalihalophilus pseudofirmus]|uniref:Aminoimidazole riboside kinase n=1 Tax=Alkalihalophilus pseudofirmus TaxID=79885 RepID=A0AAJ2KT32_ALKPS|nr:aminoimidazole riboside kinase [Alkalihalophilus pseudofirmus]MDV2884169.1 aminoimidazole riboside kinase [Alkalihalophilus pseudofirmus]WEG18182.1 aminoimidazole riboside kinase [Alkalihalophilus pseudofirmus]